MMLYRNDYKGNAYCRNTDQRDQKNKKRNIVGRTIWNHLNKRRLTGSVYE